VRADCGVVGFDAEATQGSRVAGVGDERVEQQRPDSAARASAATPIDNSGTSVGRIRSRGLLGKEPVTTLLPTG